MKHRFIPGARVETVKPEVESKDWTPEALASRKWGVTGKIICEHNAHGLCYEVEHKDGTVGSYEPRELVELDGCSYTPEERADMLRKMENVANTFYRHAAAAGCHALIEFTGLMTEFIKVCDEAHREGKQFPFSNTHSGVSLPFKPYQLAYLAEKLNCIYGPSLLATEEGRNAFITTLFDGAYKLVPVPTKDEYPAAHLDP